MKRLQYLSDVHLEIKNKIPKINKVGDYLALLGDIGNPYNKNYKNFISQAADKFEKVFVISGNHEYWNNINMKNTDCQIDKVCMNFPNVYFLNNTFFHDKDFIFFGATLWSEIKNFQTKKEIGDRWKIIYDKELITDHNINSIHFRTRKYIKNIPDNKKVIILTHHLPSYSMITPQYQGEKYKPVHDRFASDLDDLIKPPMVAWLCGHSHCQYDTYINNVYCGINSVGYKDNHIPNRVVTLT